MVDSILSILDTDYLLTFILSLPRNSQKFKRCIQYHTRVSLSSTLYITFVFYTNFLYTPSFLLEFAWFLTTTMSIVCLILVHSFLCLSLISDTNMFNRSIFRNISGDADSKWSMSWCPYELPFLGLASVRSIINGKYLSIATTYRSISAQSACPALHMYSTNKIPCNHWWRLTLSYYFIFWTMFK